MDDKWIKSFMSGALVLTMGQKRFSPRENEYRTAGTYTETIPYGATTVVIELWGSSGDSGRGNADRETGTEIFGGGGGSGAYCRSQYNIVGKGGQTFSITIQANGSTTSSTILAGTVTGFTGMVSPGGSNALGSFGGSGGALASGGNQTNSIGRPGYDGGASGGAGGSAVAGLYSSGFPGANGLLAVRPGGPAVANFYYT